MQASQEIAGNVDPERLGLAWSDFEEVHRRQPENGSARAGLAYCQAQKGHHDEVIALTEPDARTGAATTAVLNNLACAFLQRKSQLEAAEGALRAIAEPDRNLPAVRYNRAVLALKRRIARKDPVPQEALDDIRAVLGAYPAHWEPHRFAAQLCAYAAEDDRQRRAVLSGPFAAVSGDPTPLAGVLFALQPRWEEQVITHLRAARNLGMDRAFLEKDPLWRNLHDHPGFKALWSIQSPRVSPAPLALRLLNPAPPVLE